MLATRIGEGQLRRVARRGGARVVTTSNSRHEKEARRRRFLSSLGLLDSNRTRSNFLVLQADTRLSLGGSSSSKDTSSSSSSSSPRRARHRSSSATETTSFEESVVGPSVLSVAEWARRWGYHHLYFDASTSRGVAADWTGTEAYAKGWNKAVALLYTHALLRMRNALARRTVAEDRPIEWLILLDSDVGPHPLFTSSRGEGGPLERFVGCLGPDLHLALVSAENKLWTLMSYPAYPRGSVNSGAMAVRVSQQGAKLLETWWKSVREVKVTPFEAAASFIRIAGRAKYAADDVSSSQREEEEEEDQDRVNEEPMPMDSSSSFESLLKRSLPPHHRLVQFEREYVVVARTGLERDRVQKVCKGLNLRCVYRAKNTLASFPGDQDRLNWVHHHRASGGVALLASKCRNFSRIVDVDEYNNKPPSRSGNSHFRFLNYLASSAVYGDGVARYRQPCNLGLTCERDEDIVYLSTADPNSKASIFLHWTLGKGGFASSMTAGLREEEREPSEDGWRQRLRESVVGYALIPVARHGVENDDDDLGERLASSSSLGGDVDDDDDDDDDEWLWKRVVKL